MQNDTCYILALIKRDDGERLLLGSGFYEFTAGLKHFNPNLFANDVVELQGTDGQLLAGQVRRSTSQVFEGIIGDGTTSKQMVEQKRREFFLFFRKQHHYTVVYIMPDGTAIKRDRGYITEAPAVQELYQVQPKWRVALAFEDVNYYSYAEDSQGNEIYSFEAELGLANIADGGLVWDANGATSDANGYIFAPSTGGGPINVTVNGVDSANPVWHVYGPATNPTLTNSTTGEALTWNGTIPSQQELIIDMGAQTATLEGANVFEFVSGSWVQLEPGTNRISYTAANTTRPSKVYWNEVVG